ncbi:MAG: hypothetical protein ABI197_13355 [Granulicella sp.]
MTEIWLDASVSTFYSSSIFDTLATPANSVAVTQRTPCAALYPPSSTNLSYPLYIASAAFPDGGQITT